MIRLLFLAVCVGIILLYLNGKLPADELTQHAHPKSHMELHNEFYLKLKIPGTQHSCCNNKDCRPVSEVKPHINGDYSFKVKSEWVRVAKHRIIHKVTPDGNPHWCGFERNYAGASYKGKPYTFCGIVNPGLF